MVLKHEKLIHWLEQITTYAVYGPRCICITHRVIKMISALLFTDSDCDISNVPHKRYFFTIESDVLILTIHWHKWCKMVSLWEDTVNYTECTFIVLIYIIIISCVIPIAWLEGPNSHSYKINIIWSINLSVRLAIIPTAVGHIGRIAMSEIPIYLKLTHWGRAMQMCVSKVTIIGSDNGMWPGRRGAIIWTNAGILLIGPLGTNFNTILIDIKTFALKKTRLKMSSRKCSFRLGLNVSNKHGRFHRGNTCAGLWPHQALTKQRNYDRPIHLHP